jgi:hypothetical protein
MPKKAPVQPAAQRVSDEQYEADLRALEAEEAAALTEWAAKFPKAAAAWAGLSNALESGDPFDVAGTEPGSTEPLGAIAATFWRRRACAYHDCRQRHRGRGRPPKFRWIEIVSTRPRQHGPTRSADDAAITERALELITTGVIPRKRGFQRLAITRALVERGDRGWLKRYASERAAFEENGAATVRAEVKAAVKVAAAYSGPSHFDKLRKALERALAARSS